MLSHELRTPLNAIVGCTRMLRSGRVAPTAVAHAIEVIDRNAGAQVQLVEDLLDVSRIVSGTLKLDVRPVELAPVLAAAIDAVAPTAQRKGVLLGSEIAPTIDCVRADPGRLQQVVSNLLVNAVKFTAAGAAVQLTAIADADTVRISVTDTGSGIDPAILPHVFDRFRQPDSSTTGQHGGLGLGLALVKHIVELHGGTVHAHSDGPGKGATFTVTLAHAQAERRPRDARATTDAVDLSGITVLVADDDSDAREVCTHALALRGRRDGGGLGRQRARSNDGHQARHPDRGYRHAGRGWVRSDPRVRADESDRGRRTCVIALTAHASVQDRIGIMDAGFDAHVAKPFEPGELADTIQDLLSTR